MTLLRMAHQHVKCVSLGKRHTLRLSCVVQQSAWAPFLGHVSNADGRSSWLGRCVPTYLCSMRRAPTLCLHLLATSSSPCLWVAPTPFPPPSISSLHCTLHQPRLLAWAIQLQSCNVYSHYNECQKQHKQIWFMQVQTGRAAKPASPVADMQSTHKHRGIHLACALHIEQHPLLLAFEAEHQLRIVTGLSKQRQSVSNTSM